MASSTSMKIRSKKHRNIALALESRRPRSDPEKRDNKLHKCEYCQKSFTSKSHLTIHYRTHTGEKPYECQSCPSKFSSKHVLVSHTRTHTGEKPFKCQLCKKSFAFASNWSDHTRMHTGEKPYECQFCDYSSNTRTNTKRHERTHTGEKPYKCVVCSYSTITRVNLKNHESTHAERCGSPTVDKTKHSSSGTQLASRRKEYKCPDCPKVYSLPTNLSRHKKNHTAGKRYVCRFCDYFAIQKRDLAEHEQREHTGSVAIGYQRELNSPVTKISTKQKQFHEQVISATYHKYLPESSLHQCRVCGLAAGTSVEMALHMSSQHKLPAVTLWRL